MAERSIRVKLIYRNYRPLHNMFVTFLECPPDGVSYDIPKPIQHNGSLSLMYKVYNKFGDYSISQWFVSTILDPIVFGSRANKTDKYEADLLHFLNMVPSSPIHQPYVVEFEHIGALTGFNDNKNVARKVKQRLTSDYCKGIICSSRAAELTVESFFKDDLPSIRSKVNIIYPAVCEKDVRADKKNMENKQAYNLLFVGNLCYRKGLEELLLALENLSSQFSNYHLEIISNDANKLVGEHPNLAARVSLHMPHFSKAEVLDRFYSHADVFILPTKGDTFGFALVDALTCGLPAISTSQFAIPEIITDKKDGVLLELSHVYLDTSLVTRRQTKQSSISNPDLKLVEQLTNCLEDLLAGKYDVGLMGRTALLKVKPGGKFSIAERNARLTKLYKSVLN